MKPLRQGDIGARCWSAQGTTSHLAWVVMAWALVVDACACVVMAWTILKRAILMDSSVKAGGLTEAW